MKVIYHFIISFCFASFALSGIADELSPAELLSKKLQPMVTLTADFSQTITDADGSPLQEASGQLTVKRPRHFHWKTLEPYEHIVVTDGTELWLYDVDLEQITKQAFNADLDKAPALLLSGEIDEINKQYEVTRDTVNKDESLYHLVPNDADALFSQLSISFVNGILGAMVLRDSFDQITTITFSNTQLNPAVDDDLFNFIPPQGIDVIADEL